MPAAAAAGEPVVRSPAGTVPQAAHWVLPAGPRTRHSRVVPSGALKLPASGTATPSCSRTQLIAVMASPAAMTHVGVVLELGFGGVPTASCTTVSRR